MALARGALGLIRRWAEWPHTSGAGEQLHGVLHLGTVLAEVTPQLQAATDVGAGHNLSSGAAEVVGLELAEFCGLVRLHQVVDAGTPATHAGFCGFFELKLGNGTQQEFTSLGMARARKFKFTM